MTVVLNGERLDVEPGTTVGAIVESLGAGGKGVAVAVNQEVVPRSRWGEVTLAAGDRVEVLKAAQGG